MFWSKNKKIEEIKEKLKNHTTGLVSKIDELEHKANLIEIEYKENRKEISKLKEIFHHLDVLVTDKDKNLKMRFANNKQCAYVYGLPHVCSDLIKGRFELDVINDYVEKNKKWSSFVEIENFNPDEYCKMKGRKTEFFQSARIDDETIFLHTTITPHYDDFGDLDSIFSISHIIDKPKKHIDSLLKKYNQENKIKKLYDKNDYVVYELLQCIEFK